MHIIDKYIYSLIKLESYIGYYCIFYKKLYIILIQNYEKDNEKS